MKTILKNEDDPKKIKNEDNLNKIKNEDDLKEKMKTTSKKNIKK